MKFRLFFGIVSAVLIGNLLGQPASTAKTDKHLNEELTSYQRVSMYLGHSLFRADPIERQNEILWGIKGVRPVLEIAKDLEGNFEADKIEQKMISTLKENAVPIDLEKGRLLLFRIRGVWDKGSVNLAYTYDLDLVEKVYVYREGQIKSNHRSVWNISNMGFAGKDVFQNAMLINIDSATNLFAKAFYEQLDSDILTGIPRKAKSLYQRVRDGDEDILKLIGEEKLGE
jgi:hypothetical protein